MIKPYYAEHPPLFAGQEIAPQTWTCKIVKSIITPPHHLPQCFHGQSYLAFTRTEMVKPGARFHGLQSETSYEPRFATP